MDEDKPAGFKGTGWRVSESGERWYQIEPGSPEWSAWMAFFSENGRKGQVAIAKLQRRTWVSGPSPISHGAAMLAWIDNTVRGADA